MQPSPAGPAFFADFWNRSKTTHPFSAYSGVLYLALALPVGAAVFLDPRTLTGAPLWLKPFKFLVSAMLYAWTFAWFLSFLDNGDPGRRKWIRRLGTVSAAMLLIEIVIILFQAARTIPSHFNFTTPLDGALFSVMAWAIITLWAANGVAIVMLMRQPMAERAFAWSLRLGMIIASVGMGLAFLMTGPTPAQLEALQAGAQLHTIGAHTVGAPDGGAGLPLTNWSENHGDLRIPHFFGLHAMQVLPLLGWWIAGRRRLSAKQKMFLVWTAAGAYAMLLLILTVQALLGQALLQPSPLVRTALLATGGIALAVFVVIFLKSAAASPEQAGAQEVH